MLDTKRIALIGLAAVFLSAAAFASTNSCQSTTSTSVAVPGSQSAGFPIAAPGAAPPNADDFNTLNTAVSPGCSTIDSVFNNFNATSTFISGTGAPVAPVTNAGAYISLGANQNLLTGPIDAIFSTVRGADNVATDGNANDSFNNWVAPQNVDTAFTVDYQFTATDVFNTFVLNIDGLSHGLAAGFAPTASTVSLCLGGSWSAGGSGTICSSGNVDTFNLSNGKATYTVALGGAFNTIGVRNDFQLNGSPIGGQGPTFLTAFDESFGEDTPEPATFALLGSALAGLAALRLRKRTLS